VQKFSRGQIIVLSVMALAGSCLVCLGVYILFAPPVDTGNTIDLTASAPETQVTIDIESLINVEQPTSTATLFPSETATPIIFLVTNTADPISTPIPADTPSR
jgi:hypothetical protein